MAGGQEDPPRAPVNFCCLAGSQPGADLPFSGKHVRAETISTGFGHLAGCRATPPILLEGILGGRIPKYQGLEFLAAVRAWESLTTPVSLSLLQREGRVISFGYAQRGRNSCRWLTPDCTEDTSSGGQGGREWFLDLREEPFG